MPPEICAGICLPSAEVTRTDFGTVIFSGPNTYGGTTEVFEGVLVANNLFALGGAPGYLDDAGTTVDLGAQLQLENNLALEDITLNGGYRYSSYSSAGPVSSYKYGIDWQVIDYVLFRGSEQHATRAPSVSTTCRLVTAWQSASMMITTSGGEAPRN